MNDTFTLGSSDETQFYDNNKPEIIDVNRGLKYLTKLSKVKESICIKQKKNVMFRDFLKSRKFKKFKRKILENNNIELKTEIKESNRHTNDKILMEFRIKDERDHSNCSSYYVETEVSLNSYTIFQVEYMVRLCQVLLYLKEIGSHFTYFCSMDIDIDKYYLTDAPLMLDKNAYFYDRDDIYIYTTKAHLYVHHYSIYFS